MPNSKRRKYNKQYYVSLLDAATMLVALHAASKHPELGHLDSDFSLRYLTEKLNRHGIHLSEDVLASLLASCNLLQEVQRGAFWNPDSLTFTDFVDRLLPTRVRFDYFHNTLESKRR